MALWGPSSQSDVDYGSGQLSYNRRLSCSGWMITITSFMSFLRSLLRREDLEAAVGLQVVFVVVEALVWRRV